MSWKVATVTLTLCSIFSLCGCVVLDRVQAAKNDQQNNDYVLSGPKSESSSRTYADHLDGVSRIFQHSNDPHTKRMMHDLNERFHDVYTPLRNYITTTPWKIKNRYNTSDKNDGNNDYYGVKEKPPFGSYYSYSEDKEGLSVLNRLFKALEEATARIQDSTNSSSCVRDLGILVTGIIGRNSTAIQFFDAMGKPGPGLSQGRFNWVGDYDMCRSARLSANLATHNKTNTNTTSGFSGNYCVVSMPTGNPFIHPQLGTCVPSTCNSEEIGILVVEIVKAVAGTTIPQQSVKVECRTAPTKITTATIFAIVIVSIIGVMIILGTSFDIFVVQSWREIDGLNTGNLQRISDNHAPSYASHSDGHQYVRFGGDSRGDDDSSSGNDNSSGGNGNIGGENELRVTATTNTTNGETSPPLPKNNGIAEVGKTSFYSLSSVLAKILLAFSLYTNGKKLLSTTQPPGSLGSIHGIRFLSMSWVVLCHVFSFVLSFSSNILSSMPNYIYRWTFTPIVNGYVSVDTFFTLSGLLTSYLTIKQMMRKQSWNINWPLFYFHRFWRLTPPYMFALVIVLGFTQYLGEGPMWNNSQPGDKLACERNWWTNLLYVNNLVNTDLSCFGHTWYLANDMQFFIIAPLMLIPFYFHKLLGIASCLTVLLIHWITTGVLSVTHEWPTTTNSIKPVAGRASQTEWFFHYYIVPWCRIGPFVVGIIAGYILAKTKGKPFRMPWWIVVPGWTMALVSGFAVVYGLRGDITGDNPSTLQVAAFYNAISRSVWGACISWVIIACSAGYGGPVNALLSWSPFVVLGRLTYMTYLIHLTVGAVYYESFGALIYINDTTMVSIYLAILVFSNMVAFVAVLALESPMIGLEKAFFRRGR